MLLLGISEPLPDFANLVLEIGHDLLPLQQLLPEVGDLASFLLRAPLLFPVLLVLIDHRSQLYDDVLLLLEQLTLLLQLDLLVMQLQLQFLDLVLVLLLLHGHFGDRTLHAQLLVTPQDELLLKVLE